MDTLTPAMLYTALAGIAIASLVQWMKLHPKWFGWLNPESSKWRKAGVTFVASLLAQEVPVAYALVTKHESPDWTALGNYAWSALLQWIVASGLWALLLKKVKGGAETQ